MLKVLVNAQHGFDVQFFNNESKGNEKHCSEMKLPKEEMDFYPTILPGLRATGTVTVNISLDLFSRTQYLFQQVHL